MQTPSCLWFLLLKLDQLWMSLRNTCACTTNKKSGHKPVRVECSHHQIIKFQCKATIHYVCIGQFQRISILNHGRLPCFNPPPPLAFGNSRMRYPPMLSEFHNCEPHYPHNFRSFLEVYFRLGNIYMNKHEFMPPQGCDLVAPGDGLYAPATRKV